MGRKPVHEGAYHIAMRKIEGDLLTWYIHEAGGQMTKAAKLLGLQPRHLYRRLRAVGIDPDVVRGSALQGLTADVAPALVNTAAAATALAEPAPEPDDDEDDEDDELPDDPTSDFEPIDEEPDPDDARVIPIRD